MKRSFSQLGQEVKKEEKIAPSSVTEPLIIDKGIVCFDVAPSVKEFLKNSPHTPNLDELNLFLDKYRTSNRPIFIDCSKVQRLCLELVDIHHYFIIRLVSP